MTCATCRRLRQRLLDRALELKAAITRSRAARAASKTGGTGPAIVGRDPEASHTRRAVLRSLFAGVVIATGLASSKLELVTEKRLTFKGVPIFWDNEIPGPPTEGEKTLEALWRACATAGQQPDFIICDQAVFEAFNQELRS